jgi:RNA-directed DNA polymerase
MTARAAIKKALEREVDKLIHRHNASAASSAKGRKRYERRSGEIAAAVKSLRPSHWELSPHFDPYHVRRRLDTFGHALSVGLTKASYNPDPMLVLPIPKPGGGTREICISTVPDSAVSYWLGRRLIQRNSHRFSSYTYAYRADRNAHHAIEHLMGSIRNRNRLFVLEYDFAKYFDTIRHEYLQRVLSQHFLVSSRESILLTKFLKNRRAKSLLAYQNGAFEVPEVGIPQGSSISLFLANVACFELDREIEQVGGAFARYADDTLVICNSFEKADVCAKLLLGHGDRSGTKINFKKSPGVSLLSPDSAAEIKSKVSVDYLSHSLSAGGVRIAAKSIARMKRRVSQIIYDNLLLQPNRKKYSAARLGQGFTDWDLVQCINELRQYLYGRLTEKAVSRGISGGQLHKSIGALTFYPNVDELGSNDIRALDGWMLDSLVRAYRKRCKLLSALSIKAEPITTEQLLSGEWYKFPSISVETKLPSFYRAWLYVRLAAKRYGLDGFPAPGYDYL